jgi:hypothetical protein
VVDVVGDYGSTHSDRRQSQKRGADVDFEVDVDADAVLGANHVQRTIDRDDGDTADNLDLVADENEGGFGLDGLSHWRRRRHQIQESQREEKIRNDLPDSAERQVEVELDLKVAIEVVVDDLALGVFVERGSDLLIADDDDKLDLDQGYYVDYDGGIQNFRIDSTKWNKSLDDLDHIDDYDGYSGERYTDEIL